MCHEAFRGSGRGERKKKNHSFEDFSSMISLCENAENNNFMYNFLYKEYLARVQRQAHVHILKEIKARSLPYYYTAVYISFGFCMREYEKNRERTRECESKGRL